MAQDRSKFTSIFDFLDEDLNDAKKNIDNGSVAFVDKSFDDIPIAKIFSPLNNNFKVLKDLKYYKIDDLVKQIKKNNQDKFICYMKQVMNGFDYYKDNLENNIRSISDILVLYMRSTGGKLSEIGEKRSLTRERIRQIETNLIEEVGLYVNTYLEVLFHDGRLSTIMFYDFNDLFSFIKDEKIIKIINYVINYEKSYFYAVYSKEFSCFINPLKEKYLQPIIKMINLEKYFNYYDNYSKLNNNIIFTFNIMDFRINVYLNYLKNNNYLFKGNLAYIFGECSVNDIISMIVRDYYPNGIVLDEKGINDLSSFITELLNYSFKVSSALAKIDELNDELILWGKLKRIHISNVRLEESKLKKILTKFEHIVSNVDYLLFEDAFNEMSELLIDTPITDKYKLYGVIKYYLNEDFYFKKMAVRKLELKNQTLSDIIYDYIDKHNMCTKDDIVADLFISKSSLFAVYRDKKDIICTNTSHTLISKLNIKKETLDVIKSILDSEVGKEFSHRDSIFDKHKEDFISHQIVDSVMLYHLSRYYFDNEFLFNSPYIQSINYNKPVTMKNIILNIFEKNNYVVKIDDMINEVSEKTYTKDFSLIYNLRIADINVFRMNKDMLTLVDKVQIDDIVKYMINNRLNDHFTSCDYILCKDLKELSKGLYFTINKRKYAMDIFSLCSFVENNMKHLNVLNSSGVNNFIDASYAISNKYTSFIELVYYILKENSIDNIIDKQTAIRLLKSKELLSTIPVVFINERYLRIENDVIYLIK